MRARYCEEHCKERSNLSERPGENWDGNESENDVAAVAAADHLDGSYVETNFLDREYGHEMSWLPMSQSQGWCPNWSRSQGQKHDDRGPELILRS